MKKREPHRVSDVQVASGLASLAINCERMPHSSLDHKSIQGCAKNAIVVQAVHQQRVACRLLSRNSIHDPLIHNSWSHWKG